MDNSITFGKGPSMAINIFHWCQVKSQTFDGTHTSHRFPRGLLTFWSRQHIVNQLRAKGKNWFRTVITNTKKGTSFCTVLMTICWAVKFGPFHMQINSGKLVMQPETNVSSELTVTLSHWQKSPTLAATSVEVTHPGSYQSWCVLHLTSHQRLHKR